MSRTPEVPRDAKTVVFVGRGRGRTRLPRAIRGLAFVFGGGGVSSALRLDADPGSLQFTHTLPRPKDNVLHPGIVEHARRLVETSEVRILPGASPGRAGTRPS